MPPIGETLREARMRQKLDIAEIESRTKIRAKYLRALENEDWGVLPGPTFVKTFLRTYAEEVGVDPHLLVEEFRSQHEGEEEQDFQPVAVSRARRRRARGHDRPRLPGPPPVLLVMLLLFVAVVTGLYILGSASEDKDNDKTSEQENARRQETATTPARSQPAPKPAPPKGVTVRVTPTVPTYACVDTGLGTENLFEGTLEDSQTFKNAREVRLNLGKRSVELRANGKAVEIPPSPDPFGLQVTRTATKEIPVGSRPCAG
jgi:cytoskeletal protein RodZ